MDIYFKRCLIVTLKIRKSRTRMMINNKLNPNGFLTRNSFPTRICQFLTLIKVKNFLSWIL